MDATGRAEATLRADAPSDRPTLARSTAPDRLEVALRPAADDAPAVPPIASDTAASDTAAPDTAAPDTAAPDTAAASATVSASPSVVEHTPVPHHDPGPDPDRDLRRAARRLRNLLATLSLALDLPGVGQARRERERMLSQLDDYLLPRLARMDAPLLAVIGGSTGAGKSTLTNSLARKVVSRSGVLRPTTRSPVLVHHPHDSGAFLTQRILPGLARITSEALEPLQAIDFDAPRITALRLMPHESLTPGLALLDAPDIDSVVEANRHLAVQLLGAADLWLFVTTAARYGDALPWEMLRTAAERGVSVAVVLDRVPPESLQEIRGHLASRLREEGLGSSPMFVIPEMPLYEGLLPVKVIAPLQRWLMRLATDARAREVVVRRTLNGTVDSLPRRARVLISAASEQEVAEHVLGTELDAVFATARSNLTRTLANGTVLRGEVLARWQEIVGSGELVRHLERATGRLTDRMASVVRKPAHLATEPLGRALGGAVHAIVDSGVRDAVDQALVHWRELPGGTGLVEWMRSGAGGFGSAFADPDGPARAVEDLVRRWQASVLGAARDTPAQPNLTGRTLTLPPESVAALVTFVSFTTARPDLTDPDGVPVTGELPPADVADSVTLARRVLNTVYGESAIQALLDAAREDLRSRVEDLLKTERSALKALLDDAKVRPGASDALQAAVKVVEDAR